MVQPLLRPYRFWSAFNLRVSQLFWYSRMILQILELSTCLGSLSHSCSCSTWGPSEIGIFFEIVGNKRGFSGDEDQRHSYQWIDRLHRAIVVIRERSHSAGLLRTPGTGCVSWYWRWRQDACNRINWWNGAQLGYQLWITYSCFRSPHNANRLHDGMITMCYCTIVT